MFKILGRITEKINEFNDRHWINSFVVFSCQIIVIFAPRLFLTANEHIYY
jgi:hypothetical protein